MGIHPELAIDSPGVILEEELTGPVDVVEDEAINSNILAAATSTTSHILHTQVVCGDTNGAPQHIPKNTTTAYKESYNDRYDKSNK